MIRSRPLTNSQARSTTPSCPKPGTGCSRLAGTGRHAGGGSVHRRAAVTCYVNPEDPANAVLERHLSPFILIARLPAAIAVLRLLGLVGVAVEVVRGFSRPARGGADRAPARFGGVLA